MGLVERLQVIEPRVAVLHGHSCLRVRKSRMILDTAKCLRGLPLSGPPAAEKEVSAGVWFPAAVRFLLSCAKS